MTLFSNSMESSLMMCSLGFHWWSRWVPVMWQSLEWLYIHVLNSNLHFTQKCFLWCKLGNSLCRRWIVLVQCPPPYLDLALPCSRTTQFTLIRGHWITSLSLPPKIIGLLHNVHIHMHTSKLTWEQFVGMFGIPACSCQSQSASVSGSVGEERAHWQSYYFQFCCSEKCCLCTSHKYMIPTCNFTFLVRYFLLLERTAFFGRPPWPYSDGYTQHKNTQLIHVEFALRDTLIYENWGDEVTF